MESAHQYAGVTTPKRGGFSISPLTRHIADSTSCKGGKGGGRKGGVSKQDTTSIKTKVKV
jgi:hypothetical protein